LAASVQIGKILAESESEMAQAPPPTTRSFPPGKIDPELRRRVMASIRKTDTKPELALRSALWASGVRGWRCHTKLLGTPDVVFRRWKVAVFCDGVWWHGHPAYLPKGRRGPYWDAKIAGNVARDNRVTRELREQGWTVVRVWDVEVLSTPARATKRIITALRGRGWKPATTSRRRP